MINNDQKSITTCQEEKRKNNTIHLINLEQEKLQLAQYIYWNLPWDGARKEKCSNFLCMDYNMLLI